MRVMMRIVGSSSSVSSRKGRATFSSIVMELKSAALWNNMPILRRYWLNVSSDIEQMSWPLMRIRPEVGFSRRIMWRNRVLLPVPLPPRITMVSPWGKSRLTWFRMSRSP